ncbi:mCG146091, partial [Mus musculus]
LGSSVNESIWFGINPDAEFKQQGFPVGCSKGWTALETHLTLFHILDPHLRVALWKYCLDMVSLSPHLKIVPWRPRVKQGNLSSKWMNSFP